MKTKSKTVQVVIEINKESYDSIMAMDPRAIMGTARGLIQRGILLPKHGRLIDADKFKEKYPTGNLTLNNTLNRIIDAEPTVLEGDKE